MGTWLILPYLLLTMHGASMRAAFICAASMYTASMLTALSSFDHARYLHVRWLPNHLVTHVPASWQLQHFEKYKVNLHRVNPMIDEFMIHKLTINKLIVYECIVNESIFKIFTVNELNNFILNESMVPKKCLLILDDYFSYSPVEFFQFPGHHSICFVFFPSHIIRPQ